jgi:endonuclease/exonuclease/phosphatase family metal-dependent hydrolase
MRFLTFNLWHGLSPTNPVAFEALEPTARRKMREDLQERLFTELKPDIAFFQEVNPVAARVRRLTSVLGTEAVFQPDLVGLKLFGVGLPLNLNSGLVIMGASRWGVRRLEAVSLSRPGLNLVRPWGSWQVKEERFALFAETMLPEWGRVLLIDTHLHHGLESTEGLMREVDGLAKELDLSESMISELKDRLVRGNQRRAQEMEVLLQTLKRHQNRYEAVILAGDFNASPESDLSRRLTDLGFRDAWTEAHPEQPGYSFDGEHNRANHLLQERFPLTLVLEDLSFSSKVKDSLLRVARRQENRPRRIDYLWFRASSLPLRVKRAELVGHPGADGLAPSDHFGVCADLEISE